MRFLSGGTPLFFMERFVETSKLTTGGIGGIGGNASSGGGSGIDIFYELPGTRNLDLKQT
jgi:hypothetical protein